MLLLSQGHRAIDVLESLDQRGILVRLLPEWQPVRSRPQRNAYHRFTVDRHLWETAANAAALTDRVARPDLLAARRPVPRHRQGLPGRPHDGRHGAARARSARASGSRTTTSRSSWRWSSTTCCCPTWRSAATSPIRRRSSKVADAVGDTQLLELLAALTEADSLATGPSAWGSWKAQLVADLVERTRLALEGRAPGEVTKRTFPDPATLAIMAQGRFDVRTAADDPEQPGDEHGTERITVVCDDVPGRVRPHRRRAVAARASTC